MPIRYGNARTGRARSSTCSVVDLPPGRAYRFRYLADGGRFFDENDADAIEPNGYRETLRESGARLTVSSPRTTAARILRAAGATELIACDWRRLTRLRDATGPPAAHARTMALPVRSQQNVRGADDPLSAFQRTVSQLSPFPDTWGDLASMMPEGFTPLADVEETEDAYVVELDLPGVDKGDIDVSVAGRRVTISGERKEKERVGILRRRTRTVGRFEYDIQLPGDISDQDVEASLKDGVLTLRLPKTTGDRAHHIAVE